MRPSVSYSGTVYFTFSLLFLPFFCFFGAFRAAPLHFLGNLPFLSFPFLSFPFFLPSFLCFPSFLPFLLASVLPSSFPCFPLSLLSLFLLFAIYIMVFPFSFRLFFLFFPFFWKKVVFFFVVVEKVVIFASAFELFGALVLWQIDTEVVQEAIVHVWLRWVPLLFFSLVGAPFVLSIRVH